MRRLPRDTTRRLRPGTTDQTGSASGAAGRSRPGRGGTRCAVRCDAGKPGTGSCAPSAAPKPPGRSGRSGWPTPTRPTPAGAHLYRDHPDYGGEVDHAALIERLAGYDGWALSTSAEALPAVLALCPPGIRVAAWHRGARPAPARWPLHAWEPVLYFGGRQLTRRPGQARRVDSIVCGVTPLTTQPGRVIGAKPAAVCRWIFDLLGAALGAALDDLYPGSGAVTRAWAAYTATDPSRPART